MQGSPNGAGGGRPHRGRGDHRPCDLCRVRKTRCLVKDSLPCEKCRRASRACTFDQEPAPRRRQYHEERNVTETESGGLMPDPQFHLIPYTSGTEFSAHTPTAVNGSTMDVDFNWELFRTQSTPTAFDYLSDNVMFNEDAGTSTSPHDPLPGTTVQSTNLPTVVSPVVGQIRGAEYMHARQEETSNSSRILLGTSSEMDPFLRSFYHFDASAYFQSSLRGFKSFTSDNGQSTLFVETPCKVSDAIADNLVPKSHNEETLIEEMEPYRARLLDLFERFIQPFYPVCPSASNRSMSPSLTAAIYGITLPWRSYDPTLPWAQFDTKGVTRQNSPDIHRVWQLAWRHVSRELYAPSYGTLQACLLLMERGKCKPFVSDSPFDWTLVLTATSLAYTLGLNIDPDRWPMSAQERSERKLLWWLVYLQGTWIGATMGRPVLIKEEDFDVHWPHDNVETPLLDGSNFSSASYFMRLMNLTSILDMILQSFMFAFLAVQV